MTTLCHRGAAPAPFLNLGSIPGEPSGKPDPDVPCRPPWSVNELRGDGARETWREDAWSEMGMLTGRTVSWMGVMGEGGCVETDGVATVDAGKGDPIGDLGGVGAFTDGAEEAGGVMRGA